MTAEDIIAAIAPAVPGASYEALVSSDAAVTPTILVPREFIVATCQALQGPGLEYVAFSDVTAVDYHPNRLPRYDLVYHLVSPHRRARVRLKVRINAQEAIDTLTTLYPGAGWPEREVYDLFGIVFDGHTDLRRLMMPDDWEGHPLRKDYAVQLRKDAQTYMPLQVTEEEFRANLERDRYQRGSAKPK
ncbi:MAG TPA: NADH-quinone oxidoreductase subunit C [Vicinamibacterales bacterium]|nr:NADH-quinone oxidoreductase subunit C [Vicinamibacterales bacterium]